MPAEYPARYIDDCIKLYRTGKTCKEIARELGVHQTWPSKTLKKNGIEVKRPGKLDGLPVPRRLVAMFRKGTSVLGLSEHFKVSRSVIIRWLRMSEIKPRSQSEAERLKWYMMTKTERLNQLHAAHKAARGRQVSDNELCNRALARGRNPKPTPYESQLGHWLSQRMRMPVVFQQAIGPYNCDIAFHPFAVEVFGGNWHWHGRHIARTSKRIRYLLDRGWHVMMVHVLKDGDPLTERTADHIAAWMKLCGTDPSRIREYWVIRCRGQILVRGSSYDDDVSIIPTPERLEDADSTRYHR